MKRCKLFVESVEAGICIGLGGCVFFSVENKPLGAFLFTVGLFTICTLGFQLYTGKVCYVFEKDGSYAFNLLFILLGNLGGTWLTATALRATRVGPALAEKASTLCDVKLGDGLLSIFFLAVFCNLLIYIAVESYNNSPHELGKYLGMVFGIMVFILCGFEHCIANMFYISVAGAWSGKTLVFLLVNTLGNSVGGVFFPLLRKAIQK